MKKAWYTNPAWLPLAFLLVAGISFAGGILVEKQLHGSSTSTATTTPGSGGYGGGGGFSRSGARPTFGQVTAISGNTMTVQTNSGSTVTVDLTSSTTYTDNGSSTTISDIQVGTTVAVIGTTASDGTVTATRVLVNPSFGGGSAGGAPGGSSSGSTSD